MSKLNKVREERFEKYANYRKWLDEKKRIIGEVYKKLHELYNEKNPKDVKDLQELGSNDDLYVFFH